MTISDSATTDAIVSGATSLSVAQFFKVSGAGNPAYLVVTALDRNEYTAGASGSTGSFSGNGHTLGLTYTDGDGRSTGIIFTWQAATGQYVNAIYGSLASLTYTASPSSDDVTNISLFGTSSLSMAQSYGSDPYAMMEVDRPGYAGSATVVTDPAHAGAATATATPDSIAAAAERFVGGAWNMDGCWVLASTIAAEAGASLPVQSTAIGVPGAANGEWFVAYNGPAGSTGSWQNLVSAGDIVAFAPAGGGGHITTCVSGSGSTAELVDNITYVNGQGQIANPANDGSPNDVIIAAPHLAAQEFAGANSADVVIYALDTPLVKTAATTSAIVGTPLAFTGLASASDPESKPITQYQLYDTAPGAGFVVSGVTRTAASAASAITVSSLASATLSLANAGSSTVEIRASNGSYLGDWQGLTVNAAAAVPVAPKLGTPTANQLWLQGSKVSLTLPVGLFTAPQKLALTYSATSSGGDLPAWLTFNAATRTLSAMVPKGALLSVPITITATDTTGLSTSESFVAIVPAAAPTVAIKEPTQIWTTGSTIADPLPVNSFADPQGQVLTLKAALSTGAALPSWLAFTAASGFTGTAPAAQNLTLKITATDTSGLSVSEVFGANIVKAAHAWSLRDWSGTGTASAATPAAARYAMTKLDTPAVAMFPAFHHNS